MVHTSCGCNDCITLHCKFKIVMLKWHYTIIFNVYMQNIKLVIVMCTWHYNIACNVDFALK